MCMETDVLVLGAGPAGLAVAAACGRAGLRTTLVAPSPDAAWTQNYGSWADEIGDAALRPSAGTWDDAEVRLTAQESVVLRRTYVRIDTAALQGELRRRCDVAGVRMVAGRAEAVHHTPLGTTATTTCGDVTAALVVDASGATSRLIRREGSAAAHQVAYGVLAEVDGWTGGLRWMDFSFGDDADPPTFLYALPLPDGRIFLEETWRLPPGICGITSELFYDGRLRGLPGLERRALIFICPSAA